MHDNVSYIFVQQKGGYPDLVATSGDYLRVWRVSDSEVRLECLLNNVRILSFLCYQIEKVLFELYTNCLVIANMQVFFRSTKQATFLLVCHF